MDERISEGADDRLFKRVIGALLGLFFAFAAVMGLWGLTVPALVSAPTLASPTQASFCTVFLVGFLAAILHGAFWSATERVFKWLFHAGENWILPQGLPAVALSVTVSVPLLVLAPAYQSLMGVTLVPRGHWAGALAAVGTCAFSHLLLFGTDERFFPGVCAYVREWFGQPKEYLGPPSLPCELVVLALYSWAIVGLTIVSYWYLARPEVSLTRGFFVIRIVLASMVPWFGGSALMLLRYPEAVRDRVWVGIRGVVVGAAVVVGLSFGMYFV